MSAWAKVAGWVAAYLVVGVWAWRHDVGFNGASLLLILAFGAAAVGFSLSRPSRGVWRR